MEPLYFFCIFSMRVLFSHMEDPHSVNQLVSDWATVRADWLPSCRSHPPLCLCPYVACSALWCSVGNKQWRSLLDQNITPCNSLGAVGSLLVRLHCKQAKYPTELTQLVLILEICHSKRNVKMFFHLWITKQECRLWFISQQTVFLIFLVSHKPDSFRQKVLRYIYIRTRSIPSLEFSFLLGHSSGFKLSNRLRSLAAGMSSHSNTA